VQWRVAGAPELFSRVHPVLLAGRKDVGKGGLVTDPAVHQRVIAEVTAAAAEVGLTRVALIDSPITGAHGNTEFLMHLRV
jgi:23S rRNA (cytidine1920-2'-O)/16S rRNA (cytidine1409-2'-O)-methyltransferase